MAVSELTTQTVPWNTPQRTAHRLRGWKLNSSPGCLSEISRRYFWGRCQLSKCSRPRATKSHYLLSSKLESDNGSSFQRAENLLYKSIPKRGQGRSVHHLSYSAKNFSAGKGSVACEDSEEDVTEEEVTEEEEKFHRATSRGSAYWSNLMRAINGSENASLSALPQAAGTEPSERLRKSDAPELAGAAQNHPRSAARKEEKQIKKSGGNNSNGAHKAGTLDTEMKLPLKQLLHFERKGEICHQTIFCMWTLSPLQ